MWFFFFWLAQINTMAKKLINIITLKHNNIPFRWCARFATLVPRKRAVRLRPARPPVAAAVCPCRPPLPDPPRRAPGASEWWAAASSSSSSSSWPFSRAAWSSPPPPLHPRQSRRPGACVVTRLRPVGRPARVP